MAKLVASQKTLERIDNVLERHGLKKTQLRKSILLAFVEAKRPLTQGELIANLSEGKEAIDRVSIYRNLASMTDFGVLHEVDANNYVFCSHECSEHAHLLLFCQQCHKHQEIKDHDRIDTVMSALGNLKFFGIKKPIFMKGVCSNCTPSARN